LPTLRFGNALEILGHIRMFFDGELGALGSRVTGEYGECRLRFLRLLSETEGRGLLESPGVDVGL
jgi:hypothetical protein